MWILDIDKNKAEQYTNIFKKNNSKLFNKKGERNYCSSQIKKTKAYKYLTKKRFIEFLTALPKDLIKLHEDLFSEITLGLFHQNEWECLIKDKEKNEADLSASQLSLRKKYKPFTDEFEAITLFFNYKSFIVEKKQVSYSLAELMKINTCTYCNRQYTLTIYDEKKKNGLIRPEFDHWLPQSLYPDLSLSYFNLIPSCKFCNSSLKRRTDMKLNEYIHPYIDKKAGFSFRYLPLSNNQYAVNTEVDSDLDPNAKSKVQNTLDLFRIKEIYNAHSSFELQDIMMLANTNPKDYIETLINTVIKDLHLSKKDAYRAIFGIEIEDDSYLNRPLSKFKMDIFKQLKEEKDL